MIPLAENLSVMIHCPDAHSFEQPGKLTRSSGSYRVSSEFANFLNFLLACFDSYRYFLDVRTLI